jgi:hypothetical protein
MLDTKTANVPDYPSWFYYPARERPPQWAVQFVAVVASAKSEIDTQVHQGVTSDVALLALEGGLRSLGYAVEASKSHRDRIRRPVLFGDNGAEVLTWEVDAVHDELGIVVEVEAGRGARSNAVYRDLVRTSLIVGARFLALGVQVAYRHDSAGRPVVVHSFAETKTLLDAIYASGRLQLPFEGVLLFGY